MSHVQSQKHSNHTIWPGAIFLSGRENIRMKLYLRFIYLYFPFVDINYIYAQIPTSMRLVFVE